MSKAEVERIPCPRGCGKTFTKKGLPGHLSLSNCKGAAANAAPIKAEDTSATSAAAAPKPGQPGQPDAARERYSDDEFLNY